MGKKIFISYKYADTCVKHLGTNYFTTTTVRDYVDILEEIIGNSNHIYKAESDEEDLSNLSEFTIWNKLRTRIYDSSITIVIISKGMKDIFKAESNQWIPREISFSLKEPSRINSSGVAVTSRTNGILAVVLPDENGNYDYYVQDRTCCRAGCRYHNTSFLFQILRDNMFNLKRSSLYNCENGSSIHHGDYSYIPTVKWSEFLSNYNYHIEKICEIQDKIDDYELTKVIG
jgi:hypothetical protein